MYFDDYLSHRDQQFADEYADYQIDLAKEADCERAYYRERELDLFFDWYFTRLDDIIRRDPSEAYEAFHERRLAIGLSEEQCETEKALYLARKEERANQDKTDIFF